MTAIDRKFISNLTPFAVSYIFAPKFEGDDEELTDRDITIQRLHVRTKAADLGTYVGAEIIDTTPSMDCGEREDFINLLDFYRPIPRKNLLRNRRPPATPDRFRCHARSVYRRVGQPRG